MHHQEEPGARITVLLHRIMDKMKFMPSDSKTLLPARRTAANSGPAMRRSPRAPSHSALQFKTFTAPCARRERYSVSSFQNSVCALTQPCWGAREELTECEFRV